MARRKKEVLQHERLQRLRQREIILLARQSVIETGLANTRRQIQELEQE